ncbi:hypothetical protein O9X98_13760 [Agrobacterium salinitolerans]|nr:hypothetical protein [Agrobacterium salinitolerans]
MRTIVLAEKPSLGLAILEYIATTNPAPSDEWISVGLPPYYTLGMSFRFPRNIGYSDCPTISEPTYAAIGERSLYRNEWVDPHGPRVGFGWNKLVGQSVVFIPSEDIDGAVTLKTADRILMCFEDSGTSQHGALKVYEWLRDIGTTATVEWFHIVGTWHKHLADTLANPIDLGDVEKRARTSEIKRFFDYNYLVNRNMVLRRTFDHVGIPTDARLPSKFGIPFLYWLSDLPNGTCKDIDTRMRNWRGTGRYGADSVKIDGLRHGLGTEASRLPIVQDLQRGTLVEVHRSQVARITDAGRRFLDALHPDCRDLDLPYRIREWQSQDIEVAKPKIAKYLNTWFGKQKRFVEKLDR